MTGLGRNRPSGGARPGRFGPEKAAGGIDFGAPARIFSGFLTGEVPFQGALPFICLQATAQTGRGPTAAAR
jgi:hypothetical protein